MTTQICQRWLFPPPPPTNEDRLWSWLVVVELERRRCAYGIMTGSPLWETMFEIGVFKKSLWLEETIAMMQGSIS